MTAERVISRSAHFGRVPESLLFDSAVSSEACRLYAFLTTFDYRRTGKAWCGREEAAERLGWSVSKVGRVLKDLQDAGAIMRRRGRREVMVIELLADVIQDRSPLTSLGGSKTGHPRGQDGSSGDPSKRLSPLSIQEREQEGAASPDGAAPLSLLEEQEPGHGQPQGQGPEPPSEAARIQRLVAAYVEDMRAVEGREPPRAWKAAAGRAIKTALADGEAEADIRVCLGIVAEEGNHPTNLVRVLRDKHRNRPRRRVQ